MPFLNGVNMTAGEGWRAHVAVNVIIVNSLQRSCVGCRMRRLCRRIISGRYYGSMYE